MKKGLLFLLAILALSEAAFTQGVGIPSRTAGIGFGNLPHFTGIRLNIVDRNVEKIAGINITVWQPKSEAEQTGTVNGLSIGLPLAIGTENRNGIGIGLGGVGARKNLSGINVGGLGVGAGGNVKGINVGGLGIGTGGDLKGISIGGLGAGSGGDVSGFTFGGLGAGAGGSLKGIAIGGLGVGAGGKISGICIGGLGVGSGEDVSGICIGGLGVGTGETLSGISVALLGIGAGKEVKGLSIAGVGVGSPKVRGIVIASASGGNDLAGLFITPFYFQAGDKHSDEETVTMNGLSVSAFNRIRGLQKGVTVGLLNYAYTQKGFQLGILNYVRDNPKGLRWLPLFNTRFGKISDAN